MDSAGLPVVWMGWEGSACVWCEWLVYVILPRFLRVEEASCSGEGPVVPSAAGAGTWGIL